MISVVLTAFANSASRFRSIVCRSADGRVRAASFCDGASAPSMNVSRRCLVSSSETACRRYTHHCGSPSAFQTNFQKKTEQLQYSTQEHNSSFYNTTHNIKTIRQILHNIKIDLVLSQTLHYYILKIHIVCDLNMNCLADITICTICRQHAKK